MTGSRESLTNLDESVHGAVRFGDGSKVEICGIGAVTIAGRVHDHRVLSEVYYIPSLKCNIISLGQLEEGGCRVEIDDSIMQVFERRQVGQLKRGVLIKAERRNHLYLLKVKLTTPVCLLSSMDDVAWLWHARYGHLNFRALHDLGAKVMVEGMLVIRRVEQVCDGCASGKQHRTPFPKTSAYRASTRLELVHADLCGQVSPPTRGGKSFFLLIVDDHNRYMWIDLMATKDQALMYFKKFRAAVELESGNRLKAFRSDRGGEFNSGAFSSFCHEHGIKRNTTTPYTPQQNGVVERRNQTVVEMAWCLLKSMHVPAQFWGEAVQVAVYLLTPTKCLDDRTPYEMWYGRKPVVKHLRTFGCTAYVKRVGSGISKLSDRFIPGVFLGYESGIKGFRVYSPATSKLLVSRDVIFDEKTAWNWDGNASRLRDDKAAVVPDAFQVQSLDDSISGPTIGTDADDDAFLEPVEVEPASPAASIPSTGGDSSLDTPPHQIIQWSTPHTNASKDSDGAPLRYRTMTDLLDTTDEVHGFEYSGICLVAAEEPKTIEEALSESCWKKAMEEEMRAIADNRTWVVTDLPPKQKAIGLKWVFKVKKDPDGNIVKHKARLVVKVYAQRQGIDFDDVYAPVARIETVRVLLALAAHGGWEVHHMDVKSAFLNGDLTEIVYVQQPPGFEVLRLKKALYGLRQAPRAWNSKLDKELIALGFVRSKLDMQFTEGTTEIHFF
jgi:hypothetical protein